MSAQSIDKSLESLKEDLAQKFSISKYRFSHSFDNDVLEIPKEDIVPLVQHFTATRRFDFLMDVCAVDYLGRDKRFDVVYHFFSSKDSRRLRVKVQVGEGETVDSITPYWKGANWFEREAYDLLGVVFKGHPNLTKILTHHQFKGHPLRKDYDPNLQQHCTEVLPIHFDDGTRWEPDPNKNLVPLNIGPSHPSTHGTLRVMASLDGETIHKAGVELGYLHRCFDKMAETHPYNQIIPYTDRLNYCSAPMNNVGFCRAIEKMLGVEVPPKAQAMRMVLCELSRVIDHIVCIGANAVDLGALTSFFYLFGCREKVYTLFEKLCGARLTVSMTRIGGMAQDAPDGWFQDVAQTAREILDDVNELDRLLSGNKIWIERTRGAGPISVEEAVRFGFTGPCLRAAGMSLDLRKADPYYFYDQMDFDVPVGTTGDVYDRYLVRIEEMRQSLKIVQQLCKNIPEGDYTIRDKDIVLPEKKDVYGNIEGLMNHFMLVIKGVRPPAGDFYCATEAANGELGFYVVSDGGPKPYRLKVRPPCFAIYQAFPQMITGGLLSDVIAILGSLNLIAGELDR